MATTINVRKSANLWFCKGGSDKVYTVAIYENQGQFSVNARWGRRGGHMSEQTKAETRDYFQAVTVFNNLVNSKLAKGYEQDGNEGVLF
jgi:predicted DNA-binding WGR domain protein